MKESLVAFRLYRKLRTKYGTTGRCPHVPASFMALLWSGLAMNPRTLWHCQPVASAICASVAPPGRATRATICAVRVPFAGLVVVVSVAGKKVTSLAGKRKPLVWLRSGLGPHYPIRRIRA